MQIEMDTLEEIEGVVARQRKTLSQQPRFVKDRDQFFASILNWVGSADLQIPAYQPQSNLRDQFLREFWKKEPHLAGVLNSVVSIDKNRGWRMVGGRNQVRKFTRIAHNFQATPALVGWRPALSMTALSFYTADINALVEVGRESEGGPLAALFTLDPARASLTGDIDYPLKYNPASGKKQRWRAGDFFRVASLPSTDERFNGLGYCAVSRCYELAKTMIAVYRHDQESLMARAPKGLLLMMGISEQAWEDAMLKRKARMEGLEREYFGGVAVLASEGVDQIDAKLVALSQLPTGFDIKVFTDLLMYGFALAFGYDPSEFWPVQFGSLGRGTESHVQHMKATGKGGLDFTLSFQEEFQKELPESIHYEFEQRDIEGQMMEAEFARGWAEIAKILYEAGAVTGAPLLTRDQALSLLVDQGVIPPEWSEIEEQSHATDTEELRQRYRSNYRIRLAAERFPDDPVVIYQWPLEKEIVLYASGAELLKPRVRRARPVRRQEPEDTVLFSDEEQDFTITTADVDQAIEEARQRVSPELAELLEAPSVEE